MPGSDDPHVRVDMHVNGTASGDPTQHGPEHFDAAVEAAVEHVQKQPRQVRIGGRHHAPAWHRARKRTAICTNFAIIMERTDEQILPAVYRFLGESFKASPSQLGALTLSRALTQALASPIGGVMGHYMNRIWVVTAGCVLWGVMTAAFCFMQSLNVLSMLVWAITGIGLALVVPNVQSVTADFFSERNRGKAFGLLQMTSLLGGSLGAIYATNIGALRPFGVEGWRFAFFSVAMISIVIGVLNFMFSRDPRFVDDVDDGCCGPRSRAAAKAAFGGLPARQPLDPTHLDSEAGPTADEEPQEPGLGIYEAFVEIWAVMTVPTFLIIIVQGIVGTLPSSALAFITLYLQLLGMSDFHASLLTALFLAGQAFGGPLGGWLGDKAAQRFPRHGRIVVCQISVASGIPFTLLILKFLPTESYPGVVLLYAVTMVTMGLLIAWPAPACNNPIFAEIVPPSMRNIVYAFDRSFEGALAACGAPIVGILAEKFFGFEGSATAGGPHDRQNAHALSNALLIMTIVPWTTCCIFYTGLHFTYPRDKFKAMETITTRVSRRLSRDISRPRRSLSSHPVALRVSFSASVPDSETASVTSDVLSSMHGDAGLEQPLLDAPSSDRLP